MAKCVDDATAIIVHDDSEQLANSSEMKKLYGKYKCLRFRPFIRIGFNRRRTGNYEDSLSLSLSRVTCSLFHFTNSNDTQ